MSLMHALDTDVLGSAWPLRCIPHVVSADSAHCRRASAEPRA